MDPDDMIRGDRAGGSKRARKRGGRIVCVRKEGVCVCVRE